MTQIEKNKEELRGMIEQLGSAPLTPQSISNLATLHGAHKALCMLCGDHRHREHMAEQGEAEGAVTRTAGTRLEK